MITPRRTRLVRVADLQTFRHIIAALARSSSGTVVVVPTRGAARLLMETVGADIVTRDELYDRLRSRLANPPRQLSPLERDVMAQASARAAAAAVGDLSFQLRPGLVAEMLRFYDQLRRQSQQVKRFEELVAEALGSDDVDRAAQRMRVQTQFLADAFRDYERRVRESGGCDEHTLRERLIAEAAPDPIRGILVTVPDWIADASGLYQADFDLLTRVPGLESLDIISTERVLASGFDERLHNWWPGLDEVSVEDLGRNGIAGLKPCTTHEGEKTTREGGKTTRERGKTPFDVGQSPIDVGHPNVGQGCSPAATYEGGKTTREGGKTPFDVGQSPIDVGHPNVGQGFSPAATREGGKTTREGGKTPFDVGQSPIDVGQAPYVGQGFSPAAEDRPVLVTPPGASQDEPWWTLRDREEELVAIARQVKADRRRGESIPLERTAIVYKHPLPYLYAAAEIFRGAGIPYRMSDALPLAAEPTSAALDLILDAVASRFSRSTIVALLRSPHFVFRAGGSDDANGEAAAEITRESVSALDRALSKARYLGELERLEALAADWASDAARPALDAALAVARALAPMTDTHPASQQIACLLSFWLAHIRPFEGPRAALSQVEGRPIAGDEPFASRERRARAAIADMLPSLAAMHAAHGDPDWTIDDLGIAVRRWIEDQTFAPDADAARGLHLLDDQAARYGDFDDVAIVGVVDQDWPERPRRNIFYPPALLKSLGWPSEKDRRAAADARFLDLLSSARRRTMVSTFTLDEDAIVSRSLQLDEIPRARLSTVSREPFENARVFADEALSLEPLVFSPLEGHARRWAELRTQRSPGDAPDFHGSIHDVAAHAWSVSAIETYLDCPFKFFAQHVLKLEDEPEDEEIMDPRRQGQFVHEVFEQFFAAWQQAGHRAVTPQNLDAARDMFTSVVDRALDRLPAAEAGLERTRLLGSPAAAGLGDAVLRMEAERPIAVVERLLEHRLNGEFTFATAGGQRTIALRGKADRLDLLEDGTFRLIDYKLGWPPQRGRALQLPIYSICAEQKLAGRHGKTWQLSEAAYLAFKGPKRVVPLFTTPADRNKVLAEAQQRLAEAVDAIERGEFPPTPDDVWRCETCSFASVCRKDYVGDV